jgi:hypothetical protein
MEWYLLEFCRASAQDASVLGAFQLILLAAVWAFNLSLSKPVKRD